MIDPTVISVLLLLGLGFLAFGGDESEETEEDTSEETLDESARFSGLSPQDEIKTFVRFDNEDDVADLGDGKQVAFGESGNDQIAGGAGDDEIFLAFGNDKSFIDEDLDGLPDDPVTAAMGDDFIRGGDGNDILIDGEGSNEIFGDLKSDFIDVTENDPSATDAADTAYGGFGADTLVGDDGDILYGGENEDSFFVELDGSSDDPVTIGDYEAGEEITVMVPADTTVTEASATVNESGTGLDVTMDGDVILTVEGITDLDDLNLAFEATLPAA